MGAALDGAGLRAIFFKGPTLALKIHGQLGKRSFSDLDLLVDRRDVPQAREVLERRGYRHCPQGDGAHDYHYTYVHADGAVVEIHWGITPHYLRCKLDWEALWRRGEWVKIGGTPIATLGQEDLLIVLCVHGAKHRWQRLSWVCDIADLLEARPQIDWSFVLEEAGRLGCRRMLFLSLLLAHGLLVAPVPEAVLTIARTDGAATRLAEHLAWRLLLKREHRAIGSPAFFLQVRERAWDRLIYLSHWLRAAAKPNAEDYQMVSLPGWLRPLYVVVRPVRLLRAHLAGSRGSRRSPQAPIASEELSKPGPAVSPSS